MVVIRQTEDAVVSRRHQIRLYQKTSSSPPGGGEPRMVGGSDDMSSVFLKKSGGLSCDQESVCVKTFVLKV